MYDKCIRYQRGKEFGFKPDEGELWNATSQYLPDHHELHAELAKLQPLVTPDLQRGSSHKWNGVSCKNKAQGQFIAESYYIYHEIMHQLLKDKVSAANVYHSPTLRCENSGELIVIEEVKKQLSLIENIVRGL